MRGGLLSFFILNFQVALALFNVILYRMLSIDIIYALIRLMASIVTGVVRALDVADAVTGQRMGRKRWRWLSESARA